MYTDQWNAPLGQDTPRPEPVGGHCFVQFDTYRALLFGGRYESGRKNDTWIFDLEQRVCVTFHNTALIRITYTVKHLS